MNASTLEDGIYWVKIKSEDGSSLSIVEKCSFGFFGFGSDSVLPLDHFGDEAEFIRVQAP